MAAPAWPGWARTLQSHSGGRALSFSWKGSRRRHSPRACSSMAGSSTALTAGPSGPGLLPAARPHTAMTLRAPKATSSTRPTTSAAPASMSACRRKVLIPARERPRPHPGACCPRDPPVLMQCPTSPPEVQHCHPAETLTPASRPERVSRTSIPGKCFSREPGEHKDGATPEEQTNRAKLLPNPCAATQRLEELLLFPFTEGSSLWPNR